MAPLRTLAERSEYAIAAGGRSGWGAERVGGGVGGWGGWASAARAESWGSGGGAWARFGRVTGGTLKMEPDT
jgi:hypothetical protein